MSDVLVGYVLAAVSAVFVVALLPSCVDPETRVPPMTSATTAIGLEITAGCYFYLGLYYAATVTAVLCFEWMFLLFRRTKRVEDQAKRVEDQAKRGEDQAYAPRPKGGVVLGRP